MQINMMMQQETPQTSIIWLDCDPGLDDTLAIILAAKSPHIKLLGISTSAGNTNLENTTKNALDILFNLHRSDVVVVEGSHEIINGQIHLAQYMHGSGGLGGIQIPASDKKPIINGNFNFIRDSIMNCQQKIIWANSGALTNLCLLFRQFPQVKQKISKIVLMGGALGRGNITPAAQFNIYFDPYAFKQVLQKKQNIPLVMIPLEVTHQVQAHERIFTFLKERDHHPFAKSVLEMLRSYQKMYKKVQHFDFPPVHDPCVIYYILHPNRFITKKARIQVDVGKCSYGRTNCYFSHNADPDKQIQSIDLVACKMTNRKKFWDLFEKIFDHLFKKNGSDN